uniref:G_PROTEIN_RECEP_F1_2 domain-containing protein n=1 Tax=Gongylonema pulchrum TaxID=637853 RepID=A0A183CWP1_9BILA
LFKKFTLQHFQVHRLEKIYNLTHLLLVFWIPTTIVAFSYMFVICKLNSMKRRNRRGWCFRQSQTFFF